MMLILSPARTLGMRQTLITGRVSDAISGLGITTQSGMLAFEYSNAPAPNKTGRIPVRLHAKPAGYFALALEPGTDWPNFPAGVTVTLTVTLETPSRGLLTDSLDIPSAGLQLVAGSALIDGLTLPTEGIAGAPFAMSFSLKPAPILLRAIVLEDNDPESPIAGAAIALDGTPQGVTDTEGRFEISIDASTADPAKRTITVDPTDADPTDFTYRPDFDKPLNTRTFSILSTT